MKVKLIKKIKGHWQINPKLLEPNDWDGDYGDEDFDGMMQQHEEAEKDMGVR